MRALEGMVAIVTGASSGIGEAAARLFAEEGAALVLAARRTEVLESVAAQIRRSGGKVVARAGDVREEAHAEALVSLALESFGRLDVGFNNAGALGALGNATSMALSDWEDTLRSNLTSAFLGAKHQARAMQRAGRGSILFTSSFVGHTATFPGMAAYAASKAGLIGLTQTLAVELAAQGIRVNALLAGGTDTPMGRVVASTPESLAHVRGLHALQRVASPEEIARSALYLASDASSFTTGTALLVDGGISIYRG
jgi:NAD(P)-dependent dehydrogenase (short-subunit alcohol dehydrogenase family)